MKAIPRAGLKEHMKRNMTFAKKAEAARDAYRAGKLTPSSKASVKGKYK